MSSYNLKWHGHGVHLNSSISGLYRSDAFTDVVLVTTDGRYFSAHQFVLSACSPYMEKMFFLGSSSFKTGAKIVVVLPPDISYATLSILLQYIYKGEVIVSHKQLPSIIKSAELLQIRGLCQGKDKTDSRSDGISDFKQQNKNYPELKNNYDTITPNHNILIPEVRYNSEPLNGNLNCVDQGPLKSCITANPSSKSTTIVRKAPSPSRVHVKKKQKPSSDDCTQQQNNEKETSIEESNIEEDAKEEVQVKDEPIDWDDQKSSEGSIKQEAKSEEELEIEDDNCYVPLTCDLCQETFTTPALWVRHIEQEHPTTALAGKRTTSMEDCVGEYPPLHCELCQQEFSVPAEWVRHIQTHSEQQLAQASQPSDSQGLTRGGVECSTCGKVLQSHASMHIHSRTHTGERPYMCKLCGREFNVKSNYLRHLRTLHDQLLSSATLE